MDGSRAEAGQVQDEPGTFCDVRKLKSAKPTKRMGSRQKGTGTNLALNGQGCNLSDNDSTKNKVNIHECILLQLNEHINKRERGKSSLQKNPS